MGDEFVVRKTLLDMLHISIHDGVQMAGLSGCGSSESDVTLVWKLWLESPRQPKVRRLICGGKFDPAFRARRPSINEIRIQLGYIASLITPHEPAPCPLRRARRDRATVAKIPGLWQHPFTDR